MRKIFFCVALASLAGCVTTKNAAGNFQCKHDTEIRAALDVAMTQTDLIIDPVKREAARSAINIELANLAKCPL